jgi:hypothetical protein
MKKTIFLFLVTWLSLVVPVNTRAANDNLCPKLFLNSRCQENFARKETSLTQNDDLDEGDLDERNTQDIRESNIVETVTLEELETYLKKIGYVDLKKNEDDNAIDFLMQGIPCGKGIYLYSFYFKDKKISLEAINDWNKNGHSIAYGGFVEEKEFVSLGTHLVIAGGVTEERIKSFFVTHATYQAEFNQYLEGL